VSANDVYVAHFRRQLSPTFVAELGAELGYACTDVVLDDGLALYLNATTHALMTSHYGDELTSMDAMSVDSRLAPSLANYLHVVGLSSSSYHSPIAHLSGPTTYAASVAASAPTSVRLRALIHPGALATAPASVWHAHVRAAARATNLSLHVVAITSTYLLIEQVPTSALVDVASALVTAVRCICYIEPEFPATMLNLWSSSTIQTPSAISATNLLAADSCSTCTPLWTAGIRGASQLVAISDTGVATSSCFFVDASHAVPTTTSASVPVDTGHRVVRALWAYADASDSDGHGTHVAGSALGRPTTGTLDSPTALDAVDFTGVAPEARLVLVDIEAGGGGLTVPAPYDTQLLAFVYAAGARIHSGSWGIADYAYSDENRRRHAFCWSHRTFVAIFAAGNSGASRGANSVLTPALAKNAFAAGASMNGYTANDIASGSVPSSPADAYAYDYVTEFSSRGGAGLPVSWQKPDALAAGGAFVWSASNTGPASCSASIGSLVVGLAGTSMSAPHVAGAAALVRQYCMDGYYHATPFEPSSALVRGLLIASTTPTRGVFPQRPMSFFASQAAYAPYGRGYIEGHGRISVARVLPTSSLGGALVVLSNEHAPLVTAGDTHRFCVSLDAPSAVAIVLGYTDYPTAPGAPAALVNDLDVRVYVDDAPAALFPNGLSTRDGRSPLELVRTSGRRFRIDVVAHAIRFDVQTYALAFIAFAANARAAVNGRYVDGSPPAPAGAGACSVCANGSYVPGPCSTCGNALVEAGESCETSAATPCCASCSFVVNASRACNRTLVAEACVLPGVCSASNGECVAPLGSNRYVLNASTGLCSIVVEDAPPVCAHSTDAALRVAGAHVTGADWLCCATYADVAARYVDGRAGPRDVVYARLARALVAALVNVRRGVATSSMTLARITSARALLDAHCVTGFLTNTTSRRTAHSLLGSLTTYNAGSCPGDSSATAPNATCVDEQARAAAEYCSGAGTYDSLNDECRCAVGRHAPSCTHRTCSGNGASIADRCVCWPGWAGPTCAACASSPASTLTYLCLGLDRARAPNDTYALALVESASVTSRLDGSAYVPQTKAPDRVPGIVVDCWCRSPSPDVLPLHVDNVERSATSWARRDVLLALAAPRERAGASFPAPPPPVSTSGASRLSTFAWVFGTE